MIRAALLALAADRSLPVTVVTEREAERLVATADRQGLLGVLGSRVDVGELSLPGAAARRLAAERLRIEAHRRRLLAGVDEVLAVAAATGVEVAFFKGLPAEARWYRRELERPCTDLDVFVPPHAVDALDDLVRRLDPRHPMAGRLVTLVRRRGLQSIEVVADARVAVDLHVDPFKIDLPFRDLAGAWKRTEAVAVAGRAVRALGGEDSLLQFLLHLNRDGFQRLRGFADVARLLARGRPDPVVVREIVDAEGLQVPVWSTLRRVAAVLGLDLDVPRVAGGRARLWRAVWEGPAPLRRGRLATVALPLTARPTRRTLVALLRRRVLVDRRLRAYYRAGSTSAAWWRREQAVTTVPTAGG